MKRWKLFCIVAAIFYSICAKADTFVVAVGVSNYQYINGLRLPVNDAKTMAALYKRHTQHVITLTGRYATKERIVKALNDQFSRAKSGDMVVFFYSGHGYAGGFCPYDMQPHGRNALSYNEVYNLLKKSKATKKMVLADACMSGGLRHLPKNRFNKPQENTDVILFLSSRTGESSIEEIGMKNGFFTAFLERGLRGGADTNRDRRISAKELFSFVSEGVTRISKDKQHPVMWGKFDDGFIMMDWN